MLDQVPIDHVRCPSAVLLDVLQRNATLETERSSPTPEAMGVYCLANKPADSAALWNMALRVEAEMAFPTGDTVLISSGVQLSGVTQGSMLR